jgi:hypothetical protein
LILRNHLVKVFKDLSSRHEASLGCGWRRQLPDIEIAANILNKKSLTADKRWSSGWVLGEGLRNVTQGLGRIHFNDLGKGK